MLRRPFVRKAADVVRTLAKVCALAIRWMSSSLLRLAIVLPASMTGFAGAMIENPLTAMTARNWKITLQKGGMQIVLYASTTDRMVERDLGGDGDRSLIQMARQYHRRGQTHEQNHRDLAIAAFMAYAGAEPYDLAFEHIESSSAVPSGMPSCYIEGSDRYPLVPVWERDEASYTD